MSNTYFDYRKVPTIVYVVVMIVCLGIIYWITTENKPNGYYLILIIPAVIVYLIGKSNSGGLEDIRPYPEAKKIFETFLKNEIENQTKPFDISIPNGQTEKDGIAFHDDVDPPKWEFGFTVIDPETDAPLHYTTFIHGLRGESELTGLTEVDSRYKGTRLRRVLFPVDKSDPEKYRKAMRIIREHNEKEGYETEW